MGLFKFYKEMKREKHVPLSVMLHDSTGQEALIIRRVAVVCCVVNGLLMLAKLFVGAFGHSEALLADGFHSVYDFVSALVVLLFIGVAYRSPDDRYNYGYGKFETFISLVLSILLLVASAMLAVEAVESIVDVANGEVLPRPDLSAFIVAAVAIVTKEILFRYTVRVGKATDSSALIANAWHQRSDALGSIATLTGVALSYFCGEKWRIMDPVMSLVIVAIIVSVAIHILKPTYRQLMDRRLDDASIEKAKAAIMSVEGVKEIVDLKSRKNGHTMIFDLTIAIPGSMTIDESYAMVRKIKDNLVSSLCRHILLNVNTQPV